MDRHTSHHRYPYSNHRSFYDEDYCSNSRMDKRKVQQIKSFKQVKNTKIIKSTRSSRMIMADHEFSLPKHVFSLKFRPLIILRLVLSFLILFHKSDIWMIECYETYDSVDQIAEESIISPSMISNPSQQKPKHQQQQQQQQHWTIDSSKINFIDNNSRNYDDDDHHHHQQRQQQHDQSVFSFAVEADQNPIPQTLSSSSAPKINRDIGKLAKNYEKKFDSELICINQTEGYHADPRFCDIFHYCKIDGSRYTFLCPQGSFFNSGLIICEQDTSSKYEICRAKISDLQQYYYTDDNKERFPHFNESSDDHINDLITKDLLLEEEILKIIQKKTGNSENTAKTIEKNDRNQNKISSNLVANFSDPPSQNSNNQSAENFYLESSPISSTTFIPPSFFIEPTTTTISIVPDLSTRAQLSPVTKPPVTASEYVLSINHRPGPRPSLQSTTPSSTINHRNNGSVVMGPTADSNHLNLKTKKFQNEQETKIWINGKKMNKTMVTTKTTTSQPSTTFTISPSRSKSMAPSTTTMATRTNGPTSTKFNQHKSVIKSLSKSPPKDLKEEMLNIEDFFKILDMSNFDITKIDSLKETDTPLVPIENESIDDNKLDTPVKFLNNNDSGSGVSDSTNKFSLSIHKFFRESLPINYLKIVPRFLKYLNFSRNEPLSLTKYGLQEKQRSNTDSNRLLDENEKEIATMGSKNMMRIQQRATFKSYDPIKIVPNDETEPIKYIDQFLMINDVDNVPVTAKKQDSNNNSEKNNQEKTEQQDHVTKLNTMATTMSNSVVAHDDDYVLDGEIQMLSIPVLVPANLTQSYYRQRMCESLLRPIVIPLKEKGKLVPAYVLQFTDGNQKHRHPSRSKRSITSSSNEQLASINHPNDDKDKISNKDSSSTSKKLLNFPLRANLLSTLIPSLLKNKLVKSPKLSQSTTVTSTTSTGPQSANPSAYDPMAWMYYAKYFNQEPYLSYLNTMLQADNNNIYDIKDFGNQFLPPYFFTGQQSTSSSSSTLYSASPSPYQKYPNYYPPLPKNNNNESNNKTYNELLAMGSIPDTQTISNSVSGLSKPYSQPSNYGISLSYSSMTRFPTNDVKIRDWKKQLSLSKTKSNSKQSSKGYTNANVYVPDEVFEDFQVFKPVDEAATNLLNSMKPPAAKTVAAKPTESSTQPEFESNESSLISTYAGIKDALNRYNGKADKKMATDQQASIKSVVTTALTGATTSGTTTTTTEKPDHNHLDTKKMIIINYANGTTLRIAGKKNNINAIHNNGAGSKDSTMLTATTVSASMMVAPPTSATAGGGRLNGATTTSTAMTTSTPKSLSMNYESEFMPDALYPQHHNPDGPDGLIQFIPIGMIIEEEDDEDEERRKRR